MSTAGGNKTPPLRVALGGCKFAVSAALTSLPQRCNLYHRWEKRLAERGLSVVETCIGQPALRRLYAGESCETARLSDYGEWWGRDRVRCASRPARKTKR